MRGRDEGCSCPTNFQLPESIIAAPISGQNLRDSSNTIPEVSASTPSSTNSGFQLIRRLSSRASKLNPRRRQSSTASKNRDTSVGPCFVRRRSDSNTTAPDYPTLHSDSDTDFDAVEDLLSLKVGLDNCIKGSASNSVAGSMLDTSTTMDAPIFPKGLRNGTWVRKISNKGRSKRVCLFYDQEASRLTWDKKKPNKFIHVDDVAAIRREADVQQYGLNYSVSDRKTLFSVLYTSTKKPNQRIVHFMSDDVSTYNAWISFLEAILKHRQELMMSLMKFNYSAIAQLWQSEIQKRVGEQPRAPASEEVDQLDLAGVKRICQKLHVYHSEMTLEANFCLSDLRECGYLNYNEFIEFVRRLNQRPEVDQIFAKAVKQADVGMTLEEFIEFNRVTQGEDVTSDPQRWEQKFHYFIGLAKENVMEQADAERTPSAVMSAAAFAGFLTSKQNGPLKEEPAEYTFDRPLNEYFISSSHNTYLLGRQVAGQSSIEGYTSALLQGCRCVEVDCWDGSDGQPTVVHGRTLTSSISFREVIIIIDKYAFVKSSYPLWISLEVHCNDAQQEIMANTIKEIFGEKVLLAPLEGYHDTFPPLEKLKSRIIIKVKRPRVKEASASTPFAGRRRGNSLTSLSKAANAESPAFKPSQSVPQSPLLTPSLSNKRLGIKNRVNIINEADVRPEPPSGPGSDNESGSDTAATDRSTNNIIKSLGELGVYCAGNKFSGFDVPEAKTFNHIFSFMESSFAKHSRTKDQKRALDLHNMKHLMRVYPDGHRISSSNFDPLVYWRRGVQMAALNWQTYDLGMQINHAMFEGGTDSSGYVLKPTALRDIQVLPYNEDIASGKKERHVVSFSINVMSAQQLMKPADWPAGKDMNPYIEVEIIDGRLPPGKQKEHDLEPVNDADSPLKGCTEIIRQNGWMPRYNKGQFHFKVTTKHPELLFVKWTVKLSPNGESFNNKGHGIASYMAKLVNLRQGFHTLPLVNGDGAQYLFSTLFCHFKLDSIEKHLIDGPRRAAESNTKLKGLNKVLTRMNTSPRGTFDKSTSEKTSFESSA